ncbi:MAG: 4Fe-4S dicluster domain-containing protein [Thermoanaerobaculia bacterium]
MQEIERERLDVDVLFVGAGPASLAGAWRLGQLLAEHNATASEPMELSIAVLEKGQEIGSHALSGAVVDPRALKELDPDGWTEAPFEGPVERERLLWLTRRRALPFPVIPPPLRNHGKYVASLGKLLRWMAAKTEEAGADIFCEFPARELLLEGDRVVGVRTGDRGVDREGNRKANFEPGVDIHARVVVLGEGPRGTLAKQLHQSQGLSDSRNPQTYSIGIKELWKLPPGRIGAGDVVHTMGRPLDLDTFGGGFLYGMRDNHLIVGLVVGLDYEDPLLDPHALFQDFKIHPEIAGLLAGGELVGYGAKAIPEGGWWAMPRGHGDGFLLVGDSGGFLNSQRLKGIHLAMKSGMLAAETAFEALRGGEATADRLARYEEKVAASWIRDELWPVRNFHQAFEHGTLAGMFQAAAGMLTGGRGWGIFDRLDNRPGHERMRKLDGKPAAPPAPSYDGKLTFDRLADVYHSRTAHDEDQPVHLLVADTDICHQRCVVEYGNPCQRFCPAAVYEMVDDPSQPRGKRLQINASNCVHCKTCDIADPYEIITWVPPEGGGGPNYSRM